MHAARDQFLRRPILKPRLNNEIQDLPLEELFEIAHSIRTDNFRNTVTYSPKVFIPLTKLCRDRCGYCTFAEPPARLESPYMTPEEVLAIAETAKKAIEKAGGTTNIIE